MKTTMRDGFPNINIDGDGDGVPDFNLDPDENGKPTKNVITISEWTPNKDGVYFDAMGDLVANDTLTDDDSGIQIQKPEGSFLPNYSIKVDNIKDTIDQANKDKIEEFVQDDSEIKDVFDVKLSDGTSTIQPDGSVNVRIPLRADLKDVASVKVIVEQKDGTYKEVLASVKDGYIEYKADFLGKVAIVAEKVLEEPTPEPKPDIPIPDLKPGGSGGSTPDTSVKGSYTQGVGGASTGDSTSNKAFIMSGFLSISLLLFSTYKRRKEQKL